jgi:hypothetical protein
LTSTDLPLKVLLSKLSTGCFVVLGVVVVGVVVVVVVVVA